MARRVVPVDTSQMGVDNKERRKRTQALDLLKIARAASRSELEWTVVPGAPGKRQCLRSDDG